MSRSSPRGAATVAAMLSACLITSLAPAQSVNIDLNRTSGPGAGAPAASYTAASGQGGVWNAITPSSDPDGTIHAISSADGTQTMFVKVTASNGSDSATFGSGEFGKLMADYAFGLTQNGHVELQFTGMDEGIYEIFVYTGLPQGEAFYTQFGQTIAHKAFVGCYDGDGVLLDSAVTQGYVAPPTFQEGTNYARLVCGVVDSTILSISINADLAYSLAKVGVNGVQVRKWENARLHVTPTGSGDKSGRDWSNAMAGVHDAFAAAEAMRGAVDEIWIKGGTYKPALNDRSASFELPSAGEYVRGGFAGTETTLEERVGTTATILSGNIGNVLTPVDNSYTVARLEDGWVTLDRLTIRDGRADGADPANRRAGGLVATAGTLYLQDCIFEKNSGHVGGALFCDAVWAESSRCTFRENQGVSGGAIHYHEPEDWWWDYRLLVEDSDFIDNTATESGGAIHWTSDETSNDWNPMRMIAERCRFLGNHADVVGGAISAIGERVGLFTSLFSGNDAWDAGAVAFSGEQLGLVGCTIAKNSASYKTGGVTTSFVQADGAHCYVGGTILWGNTSATAAPLLQRQLRTTNSADPAALLELFHSCLQGDYSGYDVWWCTNADPLFADPDGADNLIGTADDNFRLTAGSPCIDWGVEYAQSPAIDVAGENRKVDVPDVENMGESTLQWPEATYVDMGCHEFQLASSCVGDLTLDGVVDAADLAVLLGGWGTADQGDIDGNGVVDGSDLATLLGAWGGCP